MEVMDTSNTSWHAFINNSSEQFQRNVKENHNNGMNSISSTAEENMAL